MSLRRGRMLVAVAFAARAAAAASIDRVRGPNAGNIFLTAFGKLGYDPSRRTVLYTDILTQTTAALMELDSVSGDSTVLSGRVH